MVAAPGASESGASMGKRENSFPEAAKRYEKWLSGYCKLDHRALATKRKKMGDSAFAFLRGTFFRWPYYLKAVEPRVLRVPTVLCVGDIHLENYGTWRDNEGRLVWGINDFDEAAELPFTSDLVRLATSALLASAKHATLSGKAAVAAIAAGYRRGLSGSPQPFILEDLHPALRDLAIVKGEDAEAEWQKLRKGGKVGPRELGAPLHDLLVACLPSGTTDVRLYRRRKAGLGSLGRRRYVAIGTWYGGLVAREAKEAAPSAVRMPKSGIANPLADYRRIEALGFRARDPHLHLADGWVVRRLSPESGKIELDKIKDVSNRHALLEAMGQELANTHRGTAGTQTQLAKALARLPKNWLHRAAAAAAERVREDFHAVYPKAKRS
jgi:hypothetical protein